MEASLAEASALLPAAAHFDVVGYACTSGAALIGAGRVAQLVSGAVKCKAVTTPLDAAHAAFSALGLRRLAVISPYIASVAEPLCAALGTATTQIVSSCAIGEEVEARVARIAPASLVRAAREIAAGGGIDGLFLSCTNLRTFDILDDLETELGLPVLSSNQVLAWHMARLSGLASQARIPGRALAKTVSS